MTRRSAPVFAGRVDGKERARAVRELLLPPSAPYGLGPFPLFSRSGVRRPSFARHSGSQGAVLSTEDDTPDEGYVILAPERRTIPLMEPYARPLRHGAFPTATATSVARQTGGTVSPELSREENAHDDEHHQPQGADDGAHEEGGVDGGRDPENDHGAADDYENSLRRGHQRIVGTCPICGASLAGKRRDARFCSSACRRAHGRLRRLLSGQGDGRYRRTFSAYDARPRRRAQGA
jgi:hypothetical protein